MIRSLFVQHRRRLIQLCHLLLVGFSLTFAFILRFDFSLPAAEAPLLYRGLLLAAVLKTAAFHFGRLDQGWWRFVGLRDLYRVLLANAAGSVLFTVGCLLT